MTAKTVQSDQGETDEKLIGFMVRCCIIAAGHSTSLIFMGNGEMFRARSII
jgi:hypothetical protein